MVMENGRYLSVQYTSSVTGAPALIYNSGGSWDTAWAPLRCMITDEKLSCSVPAGQCEGDPFDPVCGPTTGTWDQFCFNHEPIFGDVLYIFSSCPDGYTPITISVGII